MNWNSTLTRLAKALLIASASAPFAVWACIVVHRPNEPAPRIDAERVLILYDEARRMEHFFRELRVSGNQQFGFIVPIPSKPTVVAVKSPVLDWADSRLSFPKFERPAKESRWDRIKRWQIQGIHSGEPAVNVVATQRIGDFTAATLQANDGGALTAWLKENKYEAPAGAEAMIEHYIRLHYYFVAFRFESSGEAKPAEVSQTIRISFATAAPYYPYREPDQLPACLPGSAAPANRLLEAWFVSTHRWMPRASVMDKDGTLRWRNPWGQTPTDPEADKELSNYFTLEMQADAPKGPLTIEVFHDTRAHRLGYSDVFFAPVESTSAAPADALTSSIAGLDPAVAGDADMALTSRLLCDSKEPIAKVKLKPALVTPARKEAVLAVLKGLGPPATIQSDYLPTHIAIRLEPRELSEALAERLDGCAFDLPLADGAHPLLVDWKADSISVTVEEKGAESALAKCLVKDWAVPFHLEPPAKPTRLKGVMTIDRLP